MGDIEGLFVAEEVDVEKAIGTEVYFGEVLGKHSEIYGTLEQKYLTVKTDDQDFIERCVELFEYITVTGHNFIKRDAEIAMQID